MTREEIQEKAVQSVIDNKKVIIEYPTGIGKSYIAIKAIKKLKKKRILLLVAESLHKKNWQEEFEKWKCKKLFENIVVECYASMKNYSNTEWDIIVCDEAHHLGSSLRLDIARTISTEYMICLSATLKKDLIDELNHIFGTFKIERITLQQAIDNEWLPRPNIIKLPLSLNTTTYDQTIVEEWGSSTKRTEVHCMFQERWKYKRNKQLYPDLKLVISCTEFQKYMYLSEQFDYWKKLYISTKKDIFKNKWLQAGSQRKTYLGIIKTPYIKRLLDTLGDKRLVCFCVNIIQAEVLGEEYSIHSKKTNNNELVRRFNDGETNRLFAIGMATEGMNLNNIEIGIIAQLDGETRLWSQKSGRIYRAKEPIQYVFYFKNTRDEDYLAKALGNMDESLITIDNTYDNISG